MSTEQSKPYAFWMSHLKRAKKLIPLNEWKEAECRLSASEKKDDGTGDEPVVNDFRNHYEGLRAYLDQREPSFNVTVSYAWRADPDAVKRAECEKAYLEAIWREQECQKVQSRKLHSALLRNIGFCMPVFDPKKWMPALKYLPAEDVRLDPDCRGLLENIKWWAYREVLTFHEFQTRNPNLSKADTESIQKKAGYSVDDDEVQEISDEDKNDYRNVTVWHIFAKDSAATAKGDEDKSDNKPLKDKTQTRYLQFAEGLQTPLRDSEWAFQLDHHEHLVTALTFNKMAESLYGFTDYKQMKRMDKLTDNVMSYIESDAFYSSIRKYLAGDNCPEDSTLNNFINDSRLMVLRDMLDEAGNPKLKETSLRQPNMALMNQYTLMRDESARSSGQNELMAESMADLKEVTAIGIRFQEQKLHQRVNLRLGGPEGYEKSIQEDAVKLLEVAHQMVPRFSQVLVPGQGTFFDETTGTINEGLDQIQELPWEDAKQAILSGGTLLKLGVDAIVGQELASYWLTSEDAPIEEIRLSTKVSVVPGSTRSITQDQQAADMADFYERVLWPTIYQPMGRFDLAKDYIGHVGRLKGIDNMDDFLPSSGDIQQYLQQQQQAQQAEQQAMQEQQQMDQQAKESDLQNQAVKNELDLQKEAEKAELDRQKQMMSLKLMEAKNAKI